MKIEARPIEVIETTTADPIDEWFRAIAAGLVFAAALVGLSD